MLEYYLRETDPMRRVYEVDRDAGTWRVFASAMDGDPAVGLKGSLREGGVIFDTLAYARVEITGENRFGIVFERVDVSSIH